MITSTKTASLVGLVGITCEMTEEPATFDECLACAQRGAPGCPMIPSLIERIRDDIRPQDFAQQIALQNGADVGFSVTELIYCPRKHRLSNMYPFTEKPTNLYRMKLGSGVHVDLAQYSQGIRETRLTWKFQFMGHKVLITGSPDLIEARPDGWYITDYKLTGNPPRRRWVYVCTGCQAETVKEDRTFHCPNCGPLRRDNVDRVAFAPDAREGHVWQVNLYGLLIEKNTEKLATDHGLQDPGEVAGGQVVYLPADTPIRCNVRYDRDATLAFLKQKLSALVSPDLPPVLIGGWECDYCPVRAQCESLHGGPVGKAAETEETMD